MPPKCIINKKFGEVKDEQRLTLLTCQGTVYPSWHLKLTRVVGRESERRMKLRVDKHWLRIHINTQLCHLQVVQSSHDRVFLSTGAEPNFFSSKDNCACARQRRHLVLKGSIGVRVSICQPVP